MKPLLSRIAILALSAAGGAQAAPLRVGAVFGTGRGVGPSRSQGGVCFESRKGATDVTQSATLKPGCPTSSARRPPAPRSGTATRTTARCRWARCRSWTSSPRARRWSSRARRSSTCWRSAARPATTARGPKGFPTKDKKPVPIPTMEAMLPDAEEPPARPRPHLVPGLPPHDQAQQAGRPLRRPISFDQPQLLCGKCHGDKLRDWRDGIHGKRIGDFTSTGKKRWFTCTECHNPHNVQDGARNKGFVQLQPETPPQLPRACSTRTTRRPTRSRTDPAPMSDTTPSPTAATHLGRPGADARRPDAQRRQDAGLLRAAAGHPHRRPEEHDGDQRQDQPHGRALPGADAPQHGLELTEPNASASPTSATSASCRRWRSANCPSRSA
jgi:hypothetical protein